MKTNKRFMVDKNIHIVCTRMISLNDGVDTLWPLYQGEPDLYNMLVLSDLENGDIEIIHKIENIPPRHVDATIKAASKRYQYDFDYYDMM